MIFETVVLTSNGEISAVAKGHASEVVTAFHEVCHLLLSRSGAWRITSVIGSIPDSEFYDSSMEWTLKAKIKR